MDAPLKRVKTLSIGVLVAAAAAVAVAQPALAGEKDTGQGWEAATQAPAPASNDQGSPGEGG